MMSTILSCAVTSAHVTIDVRSLFRWTSAGRARPSMSTAPPARACRDRDLEQRVDGRRARRWHVRRRSGTAGGEHRLDERLRALVVGVDHVASVRFGLRPTRGSCARRARCGRPRFEPTKSHASRYSAARASASMSLAPCRNSSISGRSRASSSMARLGAASRLWLPMVMRISLTRGNHVASIARIGCSGRASGNHDPVAPVVGVLLGEQDRAAGDLDVAEQLAEHLEGPRRRVVHRLGHPRSRGRRRTPASSAPGSWSAA